MNIIYKIPGLLDGKSFCCQHYPKVRARSEFALDETSSIWKHQAGRQEAKAINSGRLSKAKSPIAPRQKNPNLFNLF